MKINVDSEFIINSLIDSAHEKLHKSEYRIKEPFSYLNSTH